MIVIAWFDVLRWGYVQADEESHYGWIWVANKKDAYKFEEIQATELPKQLKKIYPHHKFEIEKA